MSVDPPAKIVIIGAGPIGLETALYARYLGYEVEIIEAGQVCQHLLRWGHVRMFSPFAMNCSPLGLAALKAQDEAYRPPRPDALLTGREWAEQYLIPLSETDLLADHIRCETEVLGIGRQRYLKSDLPGDAGRGDDPFRIECLDFQALATESNQGIESGLRLTSAQVVIDCSGTWGNHNEYAPGGLQSTLGTSMPNVTYTIPDCLGREREQYQGQHTLVLGCGYSAATTVVHLAKLSKEDPATQVTWLTRRAAEASGPIRRFTDDPLAERDALAQRANKLATGGDSPVRWIDAAQMISVTETEDGRLLVRYQVFTPLSPEQQDDDGQEQTSEEHEITVDRVVANVGYRPNIDMFRELQVHLCYATEGPMGLAQALLAGEGAEADCLAQPRPEATALVTTEPNFYILGAKSYGRNSNFLFATGLDQIREVFTVIGGRASLNLYESVKNLL